MNPIAMHLSRTPDSKYIYKYLCDAIGAETVVG